MKHIFPYLILLLATLGVVAIARAQHRRGVYAPLSAWWRGTSRLMRCLVTVFVLTAVAYGADKILGGHIGEGMRTLGGAVASLCTNVFNALEQQTGYSFSKALTNETHSLTMPDNAQLAERIARRGAHQDGFHHFDSFTNRLVRAGLDLENPVWIQTDGTITVRSPAPEIPIEELSLYTTYSNITIYAPLQGSYGLLPATRWPEFNVSRIWMAVTDRGTRVITWEGAFRDRDTAQPVSFQAEFHENGDITYRYNPAQTNFTGIGLFRNGAALTFGLSDFQDLQDFPDLAGLTTNHLPLTTLHLSYIGDLSDGSGDTDDDGLTDWEEVKRYHTDPHGADTDGDGLVDGYEVQNGTDPLNPDSNGDGMPDGWSQEQYAAHRLFNWQEGDRTVTISLLASTPASNRAVLRIGDMPILLCETNSWTFSIPTGTVWNVELRTDGLPVQLALEGGSGIFAENADDIFASCLLEEEQQEPLRSTPPPTRSAATGSNGGSGKIYAPCIFLEPSMQVVHENESATVWARCVPETPSLSGKLTWSFEPDYMVAHVNVASDKLSATVSGMDDEWHSSVTLYVNAGGCLATPAIVYYCNGHDNCPTNYVSFPPNHTNVTINPVFRHCGHPFYDDLDAPEVFLEVEVGRDTATGWQHLAWVDTDSETPGLQQRTAISRDTPPTISWNAKATSSAPLADGLNTIRYNDSFSFLRALPAVSAGQYVPPPFVTIVSRTFDDHDNLIREFSTTLAIPQYVQITWTSTALNALCQPIVYSFPGEGIHPPTNITLFAGCTHNQSFDLLSQVVQFFRERIPNACSLIVVGPDTIVPQPHKTISIHSGFYVRPSGAVMRSYIGSTPRESCHERNDSPSGEAGVYIAAIREGMSSYYGKFRAEEGTVAFEPKNDWSSVSLPVPNASMAKFIALVALHEFGHTVGVTPSAVSNDTGHNSCTCGIHHMDSGGTRFMPMYFEPFWIMFWKPENAQYLESVFQPMNQE